MFLRLYRVVITTPARLGRGKTFAVPLPVLTVPASRRDNAGGILVTRTITYILRYAQGRLYNAAGRLSRA